MAKDDFTVKIEDGKIMFMTSYRDEFGEECKVANIISKERLIEIRDNCNRALAEVKTESEGLPLHVVSGSLPSDEQIEIKFPSEVGQSVIMERDMTYDDVRQANFFRRQGAKWLRDLLMQ